jgi:hypothetical protein
MVPTPLELLDVDPRYSFDPVALVLRNPPDGDEDDEEEEPDDEEDEEEDDHNGNDGYSE